MSDDFFSDFEDSDFSEEAAGQDDDFAPVKAGDYDVTVIGAERKGFNNADGERIELCVQINAGQPFANRLMWASFNLTYSNPDNDAEKNEQIRKYARSDFARACRALGYTRKPAPGTFFDSVINRTSRVKVTNRQWNGETQAEIKSWKKGSNSAPSAGFEKSEGTGFAKEIPKGWG